jgi:acetyl-CoA carboxylase biotin carboxyl carrier protein
MKVTRNKKTAEASDPDIPGVDLNQVERVLEFMAGHNLEEFEYSQGDFHIRLKRAVAGRAAAPVYHASDVSHDSAPSLATTASSAVPTAPAPAAAPKEELHVVKSPIVGTFYLAPGPDAPPFCKVGDTIQAGQVVCIVEAMKLMNEIEADMAGEIVGVLAENGQPVEYGQSLFAIRPAKKKK